MIRPLFCGKYRHFYRIAMGWLFQALCLSVAASVVTCGCHSLPLDPQAVDQVSLEMVDESAAATSESEVGRFPASGPSDGPTGLTDADRRAISEILVDYEQFGPVDPAMRRQLFAAFEDVGPESRAMLLNDLRNRLAYRRQQVERQRQQADPKVDTQPNPAAAVSRATDLIDRLDSPQPASVSQPTPLSPMADNSPEHREQVLRRDTLRALSAATSSDGPHLSSSNQAGSPDSSDDLRNVSYESTDSAASKDRLAEAIGQLEREVSPTPTTDREFAEHARLRMLYLADGRRHDALKEIPSMSREMREFWTKQMYGLATLVDTELVSQPSLRIAQAQQQLAEAMDHLGEASPLIVKNLTFVTSVDSYGVYTPFDKCEFTSGQEVLLYTEVENFTSKDCGARGFHTALRSSYEIFDSSGRQVATHEFDTDEGYCQNSRRDFFVGFQFTIPPTLYPGRHTLRLTVADVNSPDETTKIGESTVQFEITR